MKNNTITGERLKECRIAAGYKKQEDVARILNVQRQIISYYETGERKPDIDNLVKLAKLYNTSTDYLLNLSDVATTDAELKSVCKYTGLSEYAIEKLHSLHNQEYENQDLSSYASEIIQKSHKIECSYIEALNTILEENSFYTAIDELQQAKDCLTIADNIGNMVVELLIKIPNIKEIFKNYCDNDENNGDWFNNAIGEENYNAIIDEIGTETIPYLRNYVARKSNRYSSEIAKKTEEYFDTNGIIDIVLMRIDELKQESQISLFYAIKHINSLFDCFLSEEKYRSKNTYEAILDFFREGSGDSECPQ